MNDREEVRLLQQAQRGDANAFALLVERDWSRVYRWLHTMLDNAHVAEDLTQDVFLKAWSRLSSFQIGTCYRAWLFQIARHCLIDSRRGRRAASRAQPMTDLAAPSSDPLDTLVGQETQRRLKDALSRMPRGWLAVFLLRTQEGLTYAEIAQTLELTEETVRWRVFKARRYLLKELGLPLNQRCHDV